MSRLKTKVGPWKLNWKSVPQGTEGHVDVEVEGDSSGKKESISVRWWRDSDGIWLQLPHGVFGFDLRTEKSDGSDGGVEGRPIYGVSQRLVYGEWGQVCTESGDSKGSAGAGQAKTAQAKVVRVRAQMPGKIIRVGVELNQKVQKGQPLLVMEAMKMENQILAPLSGTITHVQVAEGQAVETGADLVRIDSGI